MPDILESNGFSIQQKAIKIALALYRRGIPCNKKKIIDKEFIV
jgi:hypothetical protein